MVKIIIFILGFIAGIFAAQMYPSQADKVIDNVKEIPIKIN